MNWCEPALSAYSKIAARFSRGSSESFAGRDMTISEEKFAAFCETNGIKCCRIEPGATPTPDFRIVLADQQVFVEVKEVTPNEADLQAVRDMEEKHFAVWGTDKLGSRIRYKIDGAKRQLQAGAVDGSTSVLVLYDARPPLVRSIYTEEVLVAMYGWQTIEIHLSEDGSGSVTFGRRKFGKGKKVRRDSHNYISAVGILREIDSAGTLHLDLFHNIFASHSLPLARLTRRADITLFTIDPWGATNTEAGRESFPKKRQTRPWRLSAARGRLSLMADVRFSENVLTSQHHSATLYTGWRMI